MKKLWLFTVIFVVAGTLIAGLLLIARRSPGGAPTNWRTTVETYVAWTESSSVVAGVAPAKHPTNFQDQDWPTFGEGKYFPMDVYFQTLKMPQSTAVPTQTFGVARSGGRPLPFPPVALWCVLLESPEGGAQRVIFVGRHEDMFMADWVVHEGEQAPYSAEFLDFVQQLACDLKLGE